MEILLIALIVLGVSAAVVGFVRTSRLGGEPEAPPEAPPVLDPRPELDEIIDPRVETADPLEKPLPPGKSMGFRLKHATARSALVTVPVMSRPLKDASTGELKPYMCPTCRIAHPVKTEHLWVDDQGVVIVSRGVYNRIREAGLSRFDLVFDGEVSKPPPLRIGKGVGRQEIDQANRRIVQYKSV